jgi:hypothetical protein
VDSLQWSSTEKKIAREAFDKALQREYEALIQDVKQRAIAIENPLEVWDLHDLLTQRRMEIDEKYDYRYSVLLIVFARLIREGWLRFEELEGLREDKLKPIQTMLQF